VDQAHGSVDHDRMAVYGSMVDHGRWCGRSSPEEGHASVPVRGTSPWPLREQEEETGILTEVSKPNLNLFVKRNQPRAPK
jgi:hypothetical protein